MQRLNGIKTLISYNFYTQEEFWRIFHRGNYDAVSGSPTRTTSSATSTRRCAAPRAGWTDGAAHNGLQAWIGCRHPCPFHRCQEAREAEPTSSREDPPPHRFSAACARACDYAALLARRSTGAEAPRRSRGDLPGGPLAVGGRREEGVCGRRGAARRPVRADRGRRVHQVGRPRRHTPHRGHRSRHLARIDLVVMGTVGLTRDPGNPVGSTAERVIPRAGHTGAHGQVAAAPEVGRPHLFPLRAALGRRSLRHLQDAHSSRSPLGTRRGA